MKWTTPKEVKQGDRRTVKGFALFPKMVGPDKWVWFEKYEIQEIFYVPLNPPGYYFGPYWALYDQKTNTVYKRNAGPKLGGWVSAEMPKPPATPKPMSVKA